jgi:DNA-binding transcriptional LysR family regulator
MRPIHVDRIDLNLLPLLDAILATESVGKAAEAIGLSKPAVSHALARIRARVGDPILVRAGQRWVLTQRARALAPRVHAALHEARLVLSAERTFDPRQLRREFRIHATDQALSLLGLGLGHAVSDAAPWVGLRFLPLEADEAHALRTDVDLALGVFHDLPPELRIQKLFDDHFVCVVRVGHPKVKGKLTLDTFLALRHVVLAPRGRAGSVVDTALAERGLTRRAVRWVPYAASALEFAAESDCVATLSARVARKAAARFRLQVLEPPLPLPPCGTSQVWHERLDSDPGHAWLRRLVAQVGRGRRPAPARPKRPA